MYIHRHKTDMYRITCLWGSLESALRVLFSAYTFSGAGYEHIAKHNSRLIHRVHNLCYGGCLLVIRMPLDRTCFSLWLINMNNAVHITSYVRVG